LEEQDAAGSKVHLLPSVLPKGVAKKTPASVICKDHYGITGFENRLPQSKIIYPIPSVTPAVTLLGLKWIEYIYYHTLLTVWIVFFFNILQQDWYLGQTATALNGSSVTVAPRSRKMIQDDPIVVAYARLCYILY
jgi:hypothetical protein